MWEGKEGRKTNMWQRNIHWLPLACPQLGTWAATQECALTGNQTGDLLVRRSALHPLSHTSQGCLILFNRCIIFHSEWKDVTDHLAIYTWWWNLLHIITTWQWTWSHVYKLLCTRASACGVSKPQEVCTPNGKNKGLGQAGWTPTLACCWLAGAFRLFSPVCATVLSAGT